MFREDVSCTAIVDSDKIVFTAFRIQAQIPVQKNNRYVCLIESPSNRKVDLIPSRKKLHRSKENSRHLSLDIVPA